MAPEYPGKLLKEEMDARGVSLQGLAGALRVPATRIHAIVPRPPLDYRGHQRPSRTLYGRVQRLLAETASRL